MSDVQNTTTAAETPASDIVVAQQTEPIQEASKPETSTDSPVVESAKPEETVTEAKDEPAPVEEKKDEVAAAKPIEPISEGQLAVKAPGFIKSIIPAKREFWLSDDAVSSKDLSSYMRGEKAEVSHDVVAWASQTGKGLLFFNKKGESKKQPSHVLALYDATDLKKQAPHEISFKLHNQEHVLKATSDAERDGWYLAIERSMETGKAIKEETRENEGYKAEKEKLDKPITTGAAATAAVAKSSQSQPKKSTEADKAPAPERKNSEVEEDDKKDKKSRSTSRGVFDRLKSKKDEKKEEKVEKKPETEEAKPVEEEHKTEEATAGVAAVGVVGAGAAAVEGSSSDDKKEETIETPTESKTTEEKSKPQKRGSIFGKMQAGWGSLKSPQKEKDEKDAELRPEVPPKDEPVSEHPPQIAATNIEPAEPAVEEAKTDEVKPSTPEEKKEATTPGKEKKNFLSGLSFLPRNRSVSPSTPMKDSPAKTEETAAAPVAEVPKEAEPVEEGKADEAIAETTGVEPLKPAEETTKAEKRQSVLGSIGRRASKAFKGIQAPKKENTAPATEAKKEETAVAAPAAEEATTNGEVKPAESTEPKSIGDVVPDAITAGKPEHQPAAVTASA